VLCGLRDRCFTAKLATQINRDAKAELNRRSQACEVLTGTGVRIARMVEHQGIAPCIPVWKTGACLSTPMLGKENQEPENTVLVLVL
jgi:hypothetical protein